MHIHLIHAHLLISPTPLTIPNSSFGSAVFNDRCHSLYKLHRAAPLPQNVPYPGGCGPNISFARLPAPLHTRYTNRVDPGNYRSVQKRPSASPRGNGQTMHVIAGRLDELCLVFRSGEVLQMIDDSNDLTFVKLVDQQATR